MILADTKALKSYFYTGSVYVKLTADQIALGVERLTEHLDWYTEEVKENMKIYLEQLWYITASNIEHQINQQGE